MLSATPDGDILTISKDKHQGLDDLEEDSSSTASFITCPEPESLYYYPEFEAVGINTLQATDDTHNERPLPSAHDISGTSSQTEETQIGEKLSLLEEDEPSLTLQGRALEVSSDVRHLCGHVSQSSTPTTPESRSSDKSSPAHGTQLELEVSSSQRNISQSTPFAATRQQPSAEKQNQVTKEEARRSAQRLGHRNLEELYARFDEVEMEGRRADVLETGAVETHTHFSSLPASDSHEAMEDIKKQCRFCYLYFEPAQNIRELDNGIGPCSHHPGKQCPRICGGSSLTADSAWKASHRMRRFHSQFGGLVVTV